MIRKRIISGGDDVSSMFSGFQLHPCPHQSAQLGEPSLSCLDDLVVSFFIKTIKSSLLLGHSYSDKQSYVHILMGFVGYSHCPVT